MRERKVVAARKPKLTRAEKAAHNRAKLMRAAQEVIGDYGYAEASVARIVERAGLALKDLDLIELNEAFAAQVLACTKALGLTDADHEQRINVNGSGISMGHPVGATGGRILTTMLMEMERRGARYGLETMCIGGGQGLAAIFERV